MTVRTFAYDQLRLSPYNVRTNEQDANATSALEASIAARGLMFPLVVHPLTPEQQRELTGSWALDEGAQIYGVLAGGRRYRAIGRLIEAGKLPADWPIDVVVRDDDPAEIIQLSLDENLLRRELRPYEVHAAIARAHEQGATAEEIARNSGQEIEWVRQQLRLGELHPDLFAAYTRGELSIEQARAYGATADRDLQAAAYAHFTGSLAHQHSASAIRAWLKVGDREGVRLLRFVGEEIYRAAGGRFELDLFADDMSERGRIVDEGILRQQAENKFAQVRQQLRLATGQSDLRFASQPPQFADRDDRTLELHPDESGEGADYRIDLPQGDIVATLSVGDDGEAGVRWWWASRKAKGDAQRSQAGGMTAQSSLARQSDQAQPITDNAFDTRHDFGGAQAARAAVKDEHGLTADGLQVMRSTRCELLRALLVKDAIAGGALGRDYLVWAQLRQELTEDRSTDVGANGLTSGWYGSGDAAPADVVKPHLEECLAHQSWEVALASIAAAPFISVKDPVQAFDAWLAAGSDTRNLAGAVLAGLALLRSANVPGWRIPAHNRLAELAGGTDAELREVWRPTEAFMGLFPKLKRLELAQPFADPGTFPAWHKLDDRAISARAAGVFDGDPHAPAERRAAAQRWVHPLLTFDAEDVEREPDVFWPGVRQGDELREAAE